jgi:hypothetical protein
MIELNKIKDDEKLCRNFRNRIVHYMTDPYLGAGWKTSFSSLKLIMRKNCHSHV